MYTKQYIIKWLLCYFRVIIVFVSSSIHTYHILYVVIWPVSGGMVDRKISKLIVCLFDSMSIHFNTVVLPPHATSLFNYDTYHLDSDSKTWSAVRSEHDNDLCTWDGLRRGITIRFVRQLYPRLIVHRSWLFCMYLSSPDVCLLAYIIHTSKSYAIDT